MVTSPKKRRDFGDEAGPADRSLWSPAFSLDTTTREQEGDVVISGMACRLPHSDTVAEFRDQLLAGTDMFRDDHDDEDLFCKRSLDWGHLKSLRKFDAEFFGISPKQANLTDPQLRMLLETTYEAMIDAGIDPATLRGSRTGVYVALNISHALEGWISDPDNPNSYAAWGCTKNMFANRISYTFNLKGPSYAVQCSSAGSSVALDEAYHSMMAGNIDAAVVAASTLELKEWLYWNDEAVQHDMPGAAMTNGGDGVVVMMLQRAQAARRLYASILHSKTQLSHPATGVSYPLLDQQTSFLLGMYTEAKIDTEAVEYVEVSSVTNHAEMDALHTAMCVGRETPLLVGSLRANIGNLEAASGLASIAKALLTFEEGMIPATLGSPSLTHETMEPVVENIPTDTSIIAVNNLGYGGYHAHTILARNTRSKIVHYMAADKKRLCLYASPTDEGVIKALQLLQDQSEDMELHSLLNKTTCQTWGSLPYRGYCILNGTDPAIHTQTCPGVKRPVWFVFSGMGSQWSGMGRGLLSITVFCRTLRELGEVLQPYGLDLHHMITAGNDTVYDTALNSFVAIAAIQIALVDVLREMKITPDGIIGHSVGEIACGYADGCLTAREAILAAYWRGRCIQEAGLPPGGMAAVGMSWKDAMAQCPPGVVAACHNSADTVTISGPAAHITKFVGELKSRDMFAREVRSAGVAFHSPHMQQVAPKLREALSKHIVGQPRSKRWISTSVPESRWGDSVARNCSVEYLVNNLVSPVLFQEGLQHVPGGALVLEIGPHDLLQAILRRSLPPTATTVGLMKRQHTDNLTYMLNSLGKCYMNGLKLDPLGIYPKVSYPVARRTPMLSPIVTWDHSKTWDLPQPEDFLSAGDGKTCRTNFEINVGSDGKDSHLHGHLINGRAMFPASGYILLAWKALAKFHCMLHTDMAVVLENIEIHRATILPAEGMVKFKVRILRERGDFEIVENEEVVCSGQIRRQTRPHSLHHTHLDPCHSPSRKQEPQLTGTEVYKELRLRGYQYLDQFQTIRQADSRGESGCVAWTGDWVTFIDGLMQLLLISQPRPQLLLPTHLAAVHIYPKQHLTHVWSLDTTHQVVTAGVASQVSSVVAGGVKLQGLGVGTSKTTNTQNVLTQELTFIPYVETVQAEDARLNLHQYGTDCVTLASQFILTATKTLSPDGRKKLGLDEIVKYLEKEKTGSEVKVNKTKYGKFTNCSLLSLLSMLTTLPGGRSFGENVGNLLDAFQEDLKTDVLLGLLYTHRVLKSCLDLVLENLTSRHLHVLHVARDVAQLHKHVTECLKDKRLLHMEHSVLASRSQSTPVPGTRSLDWDLVSSTAEGVGPFHLVVVDNALCEQADLLAALTGITRVMADTSYIIIKEPTDNFHVPITLGMLRGMLSGSHDDKAPTNTWQRTETWLETFKCVGLELLSSKTDGHLSSMFVLRKRTQESEVTVSSQIIVDVSSLDCSWVGELKEQVVACEGRSAGHNLWLLADKQPASGVLGMVRCLSLEPAGSKVRCVFLEEAGDVTMEGLKDSDMFKQLVQKDMVMNVYKAGHWGSYRHLPLQNDVALQMTSCGHVELEGVQPVWVSMLPPPCPPDNVTDTVLCYPKFCLVDNMQAWTAGSQKHSLGLGDLDTTIRFRGMGTVFSGHDYSGRRVMGAVPAQGVSTQLLAPKHHLWEVPATWSLEQACSVPLAYATAYYALHMCANLQKHQSILFCGSNLTSHAAITVAQHIGSQVFIVLESDQAKHELPQQLGDKLKPQQMLLTKEGYFYSDVLHKTRGKGVDVLFDCDGSPSYQNAAYCLQAGGTFLQLTGDTDNTNTKFEQVLQRCCSYCPVNMGQLAASQEEQLSHLVHCGLQTGIVKPFPVTVVHHDKLSKAFSQTNKASEHVAIKAVKSSQTLCRWRTDEVFREPQPHRYTR